MGSYPLLKKSGALALAIGGLSGLLAQAALTHGCGRTADSRTTSMPEPQVPMQASVAAEPTTASDGVAAPTPVASRPAPDPNLLYMVATKAPPLDAFRFGSPAQAPPNAKQRLPAQSNER